MVLAAELNNKYKRTSLMDCFALALALQERATLITGDRELRAAAKKENAVLKGTIWLVEIMIIENIISTKKAFQASKKMEQGDRKIGRASCRERVENGEMRRREKTKGKNKKHTE